MPKKHVATCGHVGMWGKRNGTSYAYNPQQARALYGEPWFRFRNEECERLCREAWSQPPPISGDYFDVVDDAEYAYTFCSGPAEALIQKCSLVVWEGDALNGRRTFQRLDEGDYYRWFIRSGPGWYGRGRLLKINDAGKFLLETLNNLKQNHG